MWNAGVPAFNFHSKVLATSSPVFKSYGIAKESEDEDAKVKLKKLHFLIGKWFFGARSPITMTVVLKRNRAVVADLIGYYQSELKRLYSGNPAYFTSEVQAFQENGNPCSFINLASKGTLKASSVIYSDKNNPFDYTSILMKTGGKAPIGWHDIKVGIIRFPNATIILKHSELGYKGTFIKIMKKIAATFKFKGHPLGGEDKGKLVYRSVALNDTILPYGGVQTRGYNEILIFEKNGVFDVSSDAVSLQRNPKYGSLMAIQTHLTEKSKNGIVQKIRQTTYKTIYTISDYVYTLQKGNSYNMASKSGARIARLVKYKNNSVKLLDYIAKSKLNAKGGRQKSLHLIGHRLTLTETKISDGNFSWGPAGKRPTYVGKIRSDGTWLSYEINKYGFLHKLVYAKSLIPSLKSFTPKKEDSEDESE